MAITIKSLQRKIRFFIKRPTLLSFTIILTTLTLEWCEHYQHPVYFKGYNIKVIDGDTIKINDKRIRLQGIDAPEFKQTCKTKSKTKSHIPCGIEATSQLKKIILNQFVKCTNEGRDKYNRQLSYCYVNGNSINREMVRSGYARSYRHYDLLFILDEIYAWYYQKGLWKNEFIEPWEWRKSK